MDVLDDIVEFFKDIFHLAIDLAAPVLGWVVSHPWITIVFLGLLLLWAVRGYRFK
jgi:hypothetical protein